MDRDSYSALMFSDKILIARDMHVLGKAEDQIERELKDVEQLIRHPIAHGSSFALTQAVGGGRKPRINGDALVSLSSR